MVFQVVVFALEAHFEFLAVAGLSVAVDFQVLWQVFLSDKSHSSNDEVIERHLLPIAKKAGVF